MPWWGWLIFWIVISVPASMLTGAFLRVCREMHEAQLQGEGKMMRKWIKTDGTEQDLSFRMTIEIAKRLIEADVLDSVSMPDRRHVIFVGDASAIDGSPRNARASELAGRDIYGHAVIAPDADFEIQRGRRAA